MKIAIIIPARWGSTRFPGKPLAKIHGIPMLQRVVECARKATHAESDIDIMVATEDQRIVDFCNNIQVDCVMTSEACATGSDRVLEAAKSSETNYDFVLGLQGDAPFTPIDAIQKMIQAFKNDQSIEVVTPVVQLSWPALDTLREHKKVTPFSGTTAVIDQNGKALWFSKNILPALRKENDMRNATPEHSPIYQHMGLYGYRMDILERFVNLPQGHYEIMEGLEQLRLLENGISIHAVTIDIEHQELQGGVDSPEDIARVEKILSTLDKEDAA